jgi:hypothetical protein
MQVIKGLAGLVVFVLSGPDFELSNQSGFGKVENKMKAITRNGEKVELVQF